MSVLALAILLGMVALVVDVGLALKERRSLQNASDAAALAGARELPDNPALAIELARAWATDNGITAANGLSVEVTSTYAPNDTITVSVTRDVPYRFSRPLGVMGATMAADASARVGSPAGLDRFLPFSVEDSVLSGLNPGDPAIIKYDSQDQSQGNSLALSFPDSSGASDFRHAIYYGSEQTYCVAGQEYPGCSSTISTEPGAMVGPTMQGIRDLLQDTSAACDSFEEVFAPDASNPSNMLISPACNPFPPYNVADSKRVVILPVIDGLCNGRCDVQIVRFALFFVTGVQCTGGQSSCEITGQYAEAAFDTGTLKLGPYSGDAALKFVRLVE